MESNIELSICITVYNQINMLKKFLDMLVAYDKSDVEFLISDDCSTDNIEDLLNTYKDERIKYIKTPYNMGHDRNILYAINHASSKFVYLFRTRDLLLTTELSKIMDFIKGNPAGYYFFSSIDQNGNNRIILENNNYKAGKAAIKAHNEMLIHPSGFLINKECLDFSSINKILDTYFRDSKYGFIIHVLIRMQIVMNYNLITSDIISWQYTDTKSSLDVAVNSRKDGKSVYSLDLTYKRLACEIEFINSEVPNNLKKYFLYPTIKRYFLFMAIDFPLVNKDKKLQKHYSYYEEVYNYKAERKKFSSIVLNLVSKKRMAIRLYLIIIQILPYTYKVHSNAYYLFGKTKVYIGLKKINNMRRKLWEKIY